MEPELTLRQLRQEIGVGTGSWHQNSAIGAFFSIINISHNSLLTMSLLLSYIHRTDTYPNFFPWRWECDINQSVRITFVTSTLSPAPPPNLTAPSHSNPACAEGEQQPLDQRSHRGSVRWVKRVTKTEAVRWSPAWTPTWTMWALWSCQFLLIIMQHIHRSGSWLTVHCLCICWGVIKMAVATDEQHNKSETAVVPSLRCSHFKVKCVETHLSTEAQIQRARNCYLDSRRWPGLRGIMSLFVLILFRVFLHQLAAGFSPLKIF